jgi:hypothetical protein
MVLPRTIVNGGKQTMTANTYLYETSITRVRDVYGHFLWVATRQLVNADRVMLHICNGKGVRRVDTPAGKDNLNMLRRENIAEVLRERKI